MSKRDGPAINVRLTDEENAYIRLQATRPDMNVNKEKHMPTAKADTLTVTRNFKVSATVDKAIEDNASELGMTVSSFLRFCIYFGGAVALANPALIELNRANLERLAADIGNSLVIHPATFEFKHTEEPEPEEL